MSAQSYNPFDDIELSPQDRVDVYKKKKESTNSEKNPFDEIEFDEGFWSNAFRTASQIPQGMAEATPYGIGAGLFQMLALGETELGVEEWHKLRELAEQEGIPFDEEAYEKGRAEALGLIPTVSNIARMTEEKTGLPLQPRTASQKALRLGSMAAAFQPGTIAQKATAGVVAPSAAHGLGELGVPDPIAELGGLAVGTLTGGKAPPIDIGKAKKPSGLTTRRYEALEKPTEISPGKIKNINEKVENEFRNIASDIIEKSPISETHVALKEDAAFKQQARESFKEVEALSDQLPEKFSTNEVKKSLVDRVVKNKGTGFTPSEYDKSHKKFIKEFIKETPTQDIAASDLVKQYRKNNEALAQAYEPGQSFAYNRAKREALQDYNKAIAEIIEQKFPDTEFSNLFKSTNKQWSQIMDAEAIDKFMNGLFDGKIKFEKGRQFFDKAGMTVPFKRALGEEGFKNFEQLMKDLMSTEKASRLMKAAEKNGFKELVEMGGSFLIHPSLGKAKFAYKAIKGGYKKLFEMVLDKPQLAVTWDRGIKAFKKGDFKSAENDFKVLHGELETEITKEQTRELEVPQKLLEFDIINQKK